MTSGGKEGRMNPVMSGMAMPLSDQDMKDLSAYFASLNMSEGATPKDVQETGAMLYKAGDAERGIPSCAACHGPRGNGSSLAKFPKFLSNILNTSSHNLSSSEMALVITT